MVYSILLCICSANILLDQSMTAKLADFGFSMELLRVCKGKSVFTAASIAQSEGYYPSEITFRHIPDRSDVYNF